MDRCFTFSTSGELIRVPSKAVVLITADGNYSVLSLADGSEYVVTLQLGQIERKLMEFVTNHDNRFIRIGKSLIINSEYISYIHLARQKLILSDCRTFKRETTASREALKALKDYIEKEER
ncbi:MAG: LytTR family DNA-binding domain-containing protein [Bacteroidales bacterium]|nr:LytTR family DNA-binding domain-containing protein [Bacteroidales bacterium]